MDNYGILFAFFFLIVLVTRSTTVLFHELGHAIPAILLTKQTVTIYIGSHGDPANSLHFRIGLLEVWFKYNPLSWRIGLCVPTAQQISVNKQIVYTLTGPLASSVIATLAAYFAFTFDLHGFIKLILIIFLGSSIFDLFINLIPNNRPTHLHNGGTIYNDGYRLKQLFYYKTLPKEYDCAVELYNDKKFSESGRILKEVLKTGVKDDNIYRLTISSFLQAREFQEAKELSDQFIMLGDLNSDDFALAGICYLQFDQYDKALEFNDKSLRLNPNNIVALNNKGYTLNILEKFQEAIPLFDKAIEVDEKFAYSYNNRGLAKIKIGKVQEGLNEINHSLKLDGNNSYAYRNLGIYHLDKGEYSEALELFVKAKTLDSTTHLIDELIETAERNKSKSNSNYDV